MGTLSSPEASWTIDFERGHEVDRRPLLTYEEEQRGNIATCYKVRLTVIDYLLPCSTRYIAWRIVEIALSSPMAMLIIRS